MSKAKLTFEKPKQFPLDHVPDTLGSNFYSYESVKPLSTDGKIAIRYKNAGSIVLGHSFLEKETKTFKNQSIIVTWKVAYPLIISVHENDTIQIINIESGTCDTISYTPKKIVALTIKKIQCILIDEQYVYGVGASGILVWDRNKLREEPKEIPLQDSNPGTRVIININSQFSSIVSPLNLVLGNNDVFQYWKINLSSCTMTMEYEGRSLGQTAKFMSFWHSANTVITYSRDSLTYWDITSEKEKDKNPKDYKESNLVTEVALDDSFSVIGDNNGMITLRQRVTGDKIYDLCPEPQQSNTQPQASRHGLIDFNLENKVNSLLKIGRYVFAATENSKISVYDICKEKSLPIIEYVCPKGGTITSLLVDSSSILAVVKTQRKSKEDKKDDKNKKAKSKPEILVWNPKLPGLEYYIDSSKKGIDSIASMLGYSSKQIGLFFRDIVKAGEDVTELSTTMDRLEDCINQTKKNGDIAVYFFTAAAKLQVALDSYESLLEKLTQQGKLVRIFTSSRLRRDLEFQNSVVSTHVIDLEVRIKTILERTFVRSKSRDQTGQQPSSTATFRPSTMPTRQSMISDPAGRQFWEKNFNEALHVAWQEFMSALNIEIKNITEQEEKQLKSVLDFSNTGSLSQYKFAEFLKGFGPFESCVKNTNYILTRPWFHGFLNGREAELLMKNQFVEEGTFIVRFSKSKPGSFALAFMQAVNVNHILIESCLPEGYKVATQDSTGPAKLFKTLDELISHYNFVLKYPFVSDLPSYDWFHGDVATDESVDLLKEQPVGTYLIRFSSKGSFAASFIDMNKNIRHVLITTVAKNCFKVDTGSGEATFAGIPELVSFYKNKGIFKQPLLQGR